VREREKDGRDKRRRRRKRRKETFGILFSLVVALGPLFALIL